MSIHHHLIMFSTCFSLSECAYAKFYPSSCKPPKQVSIRVFNKSPYSYTVFNCFCILFLVHFIYNVMQKCTIGTFWCLSDELLSILIIGIWPQTFFYKLTLKCAMVSRFTRTTTFYILFINLTSFGSALYYCFIWKTRTIYMILNYN